jgi:type IV secretion system protein VirD4
MRFLIWQAMLKAYLITQDIRQIVDAYGNNESIVSNCHIRIAFAPNQFDTADLLSKMTGTTTVSKASYNYSGSRFAPVMAHVNASVDYVERPLMTPDEVLRLRPSQKIGRSASGVQFSVPHSSRAVTICHGLERRPTVTY